VKIMNTGKLDKKLSFEGVEMSEATKKTLGL
jgi:hypothetical protein